MGDWQKGKLMTKVDKKQLMKNLIVGLLVVAAVLGFMFYHGMLGKVGKYVLDKTNVAENYNMYAIAENEEKLAEQSSDIEGWTKLDKYKAGLDPNDGADTDGDGLTDKEEIEGCCT